MPGYDRARAPEAERSASAGTCERCRESFRGRADKRFCSDRRRTAVGRAETARQREVERQRFEHAIKVLRAALDEVRRLLPGSEIR